MNDEPTKMYGEKKYAEIILLETNLSKIFHYDIPEDLSEDICLGARVSVPFKKNLVTGCIVGFLQKSNIKSTKSILQLIDSKPLLPPTLLELTKWISDYYICSWGKVLHYVIPKNKQKLLSDSEIVDITPSKSLITEDKDFTGYQDIIVKNIKNTIFSDIEKLIKYEKYQPILLNKGSFEEKLEVYFQLIQKALYKGKQIIILTPTESHLSELSKLFTKRFGKRVIVFNENLSQKNRFMQWVKIKNSQYDIVLGMRSAIFVPFEKLGLIIVDQEHNSLYKEERMPRYNAREVALKRAELEKVPIILSSETPSFESFWNVCQGNYLGINLNVDKDNKMLKNIIVDMTKDKSPRKIVSYELQEAISKSLKNGKQVILFLNRRGFFSFVICGKCGFVPRCPDCNSTFSCHLNFAREAQLVCHNCGKRNKVVNLCEQCGSKDIRSLGIGTQRLESEIKKMFPKAKINRLDRDSIVKKEDSEKILLDFKERKIDIIIGTQMVIKKIDFNNVDLIGIVSADTLLNLPDYRSAEKTFQLLSEIISNFKSEDLSKKVIIQTFNPDNHCIIALKERDYDYFFENEIQSRKELNYPPFTHIIRIEIKGKEKEKVEQNIKLVIEYLNSISQIKGTPEFDLLGSKNILTWKSQNNFRVQITVKVKDLEKFSKMFKENLEKTLLDSFDRENRLILDVDPIKML